MAPALEMHLLGIGVVELALTQLAVEADSFALIIAHYVNVFMTNRGNIFFSKNVQVIVILSCQNKNVINCFIMPANKHHDQEHPIKPNNY
jgi:hypothetical protein